MNAWGLTDATDPEELERLAERASRPEPDDVRQARYAAERRSWARKIGRPVPDERPVVGLVSSAD